MGAASCAAAPVVEEQADETDVRLAEVAVTSSAAKPDEVPLWKLEAEAARAAGEAAALAAAEAAAVAEAQAAAAAASAEEAKAKVMAADAAKKQAKADAAKPRVKAKAKAKEKVAQGNETAENAAATNKKAEEEAEKPKPRRTGFGKQELTMAEAKDALDKAIELFDKPENTKRLKAAMKDVKKRVKDKSAQQMAMISTIVPIAQGIFGELLVEYGFKKDDAMEAMMQIFDKAEKDRSGDMMAKFEKVKGMMAGQL